MKIHSYLSSSIYSARVRGSSSPDSSIPFFSTSGSRSRRSASSASPPSARRHGPFPNQLSPAPPFRGAPPGNPSRSFAPNPDRFDPIHQALPLLQPEHGSRTRGQGANSFCNHFIPFDEVRLRGLDEEVIRVHHPPGLSAHLQHSLRKKLRSSSSKNISSWRFPRAITW